ncbi:MAG: asparagine synthase (glutamine-hydrolyzing) [Planctomycetota bacterium]
MCGIAGIWHWDPEDRVDPEALQRMSAALWHRGPDSSGRYLEGSFGMTMRRLKVIDPIGGEQPAPSADFRRVMVYNGEVYNYRKLQKELEDRGHDFRSVSDTEVVVTAFSEWGSAALERLNGMFALAVWDRERRRLMLARDRLGIKPLYWTRNDRGLYFASELKALLASGEIDRRVDPEALQIYLEYGHVPSPKSVLKGIRKVAPGERIEAIDQRQVFRTRYWDFPKPSPLAFRRSDAIERVHRSLRAATVRRLRADVPVGFFLSGGVDSAALVALACESGLERPRTFTIGFPEPRWDERERARWIAERFHTRHEELIVEPESTDTLETMAWHLDEPFADTSALPTWHLCRLASEHVTVALAGDGSDELFAGYDHFPVHRLSEMYRRLPGWLRHVLIREPIRMGQRFSGGELRARLARIRRAIEAAELPATARYLLKSQIVFPTAWRSHIAGPALAEPPTMPWENRWRQILGDASRGEFLERVSALNATTTLPDRMLTKVDRLSMAQALEVRVPFLDHHFVELTSRIAFDDKLNGLKTKWVLKQAIRHLVPPSYTKARKKGFVPPLEAWFKSDLFDFAREVFHDPRTRGRGWVRSGVGGQLLDEHRAGKVDHSQRIWSLLMLELWARQVLDRRVDWSVRQEAPVPSQKIIPSGS